MITILNKSFYKNKDIGYYIGRPSILGNPFIIGKDGSRDEVIAKYERWLRDRIKLNGHIYHEINRLAKIAKDNDLILTCWCAPERCHGDVIKKIIEEINGKICIKDN